MTRILEEKKLVLNIVKKKIQFIEADDVEYARLMGILE